MNRTVGSHQLEVIESSAIRVRQINEISSRYREYSEYRKLLTRILGGEISKQVRDQRYPR